MEKDCREIFESEFEPRGFSMTKDKHGYYTNPNTDFIYRGWEAAWKYDDVRERIFNGTPHYSTKYFYKAADRFHFRIDDEGVCWHEKIIEDQQTNKSVLEE